MEIKINKGQIITSVCLAVAGWFALETYVQGQRISALEENREVNTRQDEELIELRKTVRDITVLFFQQQEDIPVPVYKNTLPDEGFSAVQSDLRGLQELRKGGK